MGISEDCSQFAGTLPYYFILPLTVIGIGGPSVLGNSVTFIQTDCILKHTVPPVLSAKCNLYPEQSPVRASKTSNLLYKDRAKKRW